MKYGELLSIASNWAAILTAVVAVLAYAHFVGGQWKRRRALEKYLRGLKISAHDRGQRTVTHLMANLAMTEAEVLHAGFQSGKIKALPGSDEKGRAHCIYFEYDDDNLPKPQKF